jgi:hypothetical protein
MNDKSHAPSEARPEINLHPKSVYRWWVKNNGKERSPFEKPRLTTGHKAQRVEWVDIWGDIFINEEIPVCYLDEKWFYTTTRRKRLKFLPRHSSEPIGVDVLKRPKCRSRRFPIKIMYLGVVGRPKTVDGKNFNGRIMMERIGKTVPVKKLTKHQRFSTDALINQEIKTGGWKKLHIPGMTTVDTICEHMVEAFELLDVVGHRLEFHYEDWSQGIKKTKSLKKLAGCDILEIGSTTRGEGTDAEIRRRTEDGTTCSVKIADLHLGVRYEKGDLVTTNNSCNLEYMLEVMPRDGQAIRKASF